jgi:hypothetical protein
MPTLDCNYLVILNSPVSRRNCIPVCFIVMENHKDTVAHSVTIMLDFGVSLWSPIVHIGGNESYDSHAALGNLKCDSCLANAD